MSRPPFKPYRPDYPHLSSEEADHFLEHGWLRLSGAIQPQYLEWADEIWTRTGTDRDDKATWREEYTKLPRHKEVRCEEFCAGETWDKVLDIVGGVERVDPVRERWFGDQFIINYGTQEWVGKEHGNEDLKGWHTDNDWYRQFLDSSGNALTLIFCFTDIPPNGGGTSFAEDGIKELCQTFYDHPEGIDPPLEHLYSYVRNCEKVGSVVAKKGDLIVTHALLPHTHAPNHLHYARVITNPHVNLAEPYNLNRSDGAYTLCEQVILRALDRESIPEYIPTRERLTYYPRTAFFKREKVRAELERMIAHAKARGGSEADVDSVYLRGPEAIAEHERRNGYDKAYGPNGVLHAYGFGGTEEHHPDGRHKVY